MASPYMLLGANPNWLSFLPRPGMWMITFERIMGFLLLAMVVWLVNPLVTQIGVLGLQLTLVFYVVLAMACWLLGKIQITMPAIQRWKYRLAAVALVLFSSAVVYGWAYPLDKAETAAKTEREALMECRANGSVAVASDEIVWRPWSQEAVAKVVAQGKLAFVDFTAAYCTVCKVNKKVAIDTPQVREILTNPDVVAFQGDFTTGDDAIESVLKSFRRAGVPLNLIYPPGRLEAPIVLETNLTTSYLLKKFSEARSMTEKSASIHGQ
jgi:thiol:disulfide interchange protein DsbD